jgi:hypothetical protein
MRAFGVLSPGPTRSFLGHAQTIRFLAMPQSKVRYASATLCIAFLIAGQASALSSLTRAQSRSSERPLDCDEIRVGLEEAALQARHDTKAYLIVIARAGDGEHDELNIQRLTFAKAYLAFVAPAQRGVVAKGECKSGLGHLELYVSGRLVRSMPMVRGWGKLCSEPEG